MGGPRRRMILLTIIIIIIIIIVKRTPHPPRLSDVQRGKSHVPAALNCVVFKKSQTYDLKVYRLRHFGEAFIDILMSYTRLQ